MAVKAVCGMRSIGRRPGDASPNSVLRNGCAAKRPASIRIVEPELPQSSAACGSRNVPAHPPMATPPILAAFDLHAQLSPRRSKRAVRHPRRLKNLVRCDVPSAKADSTAYRCEMLLSPGRRRLPSTFRAGITTRVEPDDGAADGFMWDKNNLLQCF